MAKFVANMHHDPSNPTVQSTKGFIDTINQCWGVGLVAMTVNNNKETLNRIVSQEI